ncbi:SpoIID/LytB domain-containing protein [Corallococcus sp. bb12-1]|uniref:SpoIID/LytB domain-containing protein n=1 Tax=Corallococcus sp. bb12-1 TaxID=2996784 RepID=UPI00226F10C3|nr:SpoIID/LytB domain-containing protein [Corallococcus sp. bb12-1]MCY1046540.1 SpoIID/LytB domain-containing protein [Corallococcus sp. bb12-1]
MGWAVAVAVLLSASPTFVTRGDVTPEADLRKEAQAAWTAVEAQYAAQAGGLPTRAPATVMLQKGLALPPERNAQGRPGVVELRQNTPGVMDAKSRTALRHELAHQLLWWACPASSEDRLFHEAFALTVSGELSAWREAPYQSLSRAAKEVANAPQVDTPRARRGLARILGEHSGFPAALTRRLRQCHDGTRWASLLSVEELADVAVLAPEAATVVVSRHSGEVLFAEGDVRRAVPYGSTLKPFLYAAGTAAAGASADSASPPLLAPRPGVQEWACGEGLPSKVDVRLALLRSCNGYFLDWEATGRAPRAFGRWGPVLSAVGLTGLPSDMTEAIGLRSAHGLSPWGMAQAYRLLAEARPDVLALLTGNVEEGTLSGLSTSKALKGVATKTGTVRDAASRPQFGWIAAVDVDLVVVAVRPGKMPRHFADEIPALLARVRKQTAGLEAARVQVLGLLPSASVEARCAGAGFALEDGAPRPVSTDFSRLDALTAKGPAVCLGSPWRVRFPDGPDGGRDYAGVFSWSAPPPYRPPPGVPTTPSALKARRGSDFVFRTTRVQYTAGVIAAEDVTLQGEARVALARVVAHNERHATPRHPGRAVCDTTHCQAFRGTVRMRPEESRALQLPALKWDAWLTFSQGGDTPWRESRPRAQVESLLGTRLVSLRFEAGRVRYLRTDGEAGAPYEEARSLPCDTLRAGLQLPSCPQRASFDGLQVLFEGQGRGHGEGLDVEAAKAATGLSSDVLLERAYGAFPVTSPAR